MLAELDATTWGLLAVTGCAVFYVLVLFRRRNWPVNRSQFDAWVLPTCLGALAVMLGAAFDSTPAMIAGCALAVFSVPALVVRWRGRRTAG